MVNDSSLRLFAAIDPPPEVLDELQRIQSRLKRLIHGPISWVRPEGIHLTLKFFGNVPAEGVEPIAQRLSVLASQTQPFCLQARQIGVFPNLNHPRVVWLGIEGEVAPLEKLQKAMERDFEALGFKREERPFRPHLTLARIREPKVLLGLAGVIDGEEKYEAGSFEARELTLFKSNLTPQGAIYTKLVQCSFSRETNPGQSA